MNRVEIDPNNCHAIAAEQAAAPISETEKDYAATLIPLVEEALRAPRNNQAPEIDNNHLQFIYPDHRHPRTEKAQHSAETKPSHIERNAIVDTIGYSIGYLVGIMSVRVEQAIDNIKSSIR